MGLGCCLMWRLVSSALFFSRISSYPVLYHPSSPLMHTSPHLTPQYPSQTNTHPQPTGTITDFSLLGGISSSIKPPPPDFSAGLSWKHFPSQPIKEFFQTWSEKYTSLEWMPIQDKDVGTSGEMFSQKQMGQDSEVPAVSSLSNPPPFPHLFSFIFLSTEMSGMHNADGHCTKGDSKDLHRSRMRKCRFPQGRM